MAIKRNALIPPFPTSTPLIYSPKKGKDSETTGSGITQPHIDWQGLVRNRANAAPQIVALIPTGSNFSGEPGEMNFDANFLYICVGVNIWKRVALGSW